MLTPERRGRSSGLESRENWDDSTSHHFNRTVGQRRYLHLQRPNRFVPWSLRLKRRPRVAWTPCCLCVCRDGRPWNSRHQTVAINLGNTTERSSAQRAEGGVCDSNQEEKRVSMSCVVTLVLFDFGFFLFFLVLGFPSHFVFTSISMPHTLPRKTHTHRFLYHVHKLSVGKYLMRLHCVWTGHLKAISVHVCRQRRPSSASSELIKVQYTIRKHCESVSSLHTHTHTISLSRKQTFKNPERLKQRQNQLWCLWFCLAMPLDVQHFQKPNRTEPLLCLLRCWAEFPERHRCRWSTCCAARCCPPVVAEGAAATCTEGEKLMIEIWALMWMFFCFFFNVR